MTREKPSAGGPGSITENPEEDTQMPRPPQQPQRDEIELEAYESVAQRFRAMRTDRPDEVRFADDAGPYFGSLLNSPPLARVLTQFGTIVRRAGERPDTYSHADREFVDQVMSADWRTGVVQRTHIPDGLAAGVRLEAIEALRAGAEDALTDDERFLATYIRGVCTGAVTDELYAQMEERLGRRGTVEYTIFIAFLQMTIRLHQAFGAPELSDEEVVTMLSEFRDGTRELPDIAVRLR
jgi:hypothetical protein